MRADLPLSAEEREWRYAHLLGSLTDEHPRLRGAPFGQITGFNVHGFDVSNYQPPAPDFRAGGRQFAIFKATESTTFFDKNFNLNRQAAHAQGAAAIGLYHFARPSRNSADAEADWLLSHVGVRRDREFIVLDYEVSPWNEAWAVQFIRRCQAAGWRVEFYSYLGMLNANSTGQIVATGCGLWVAAYGSNAPGSDRWDHFDFWQHTDGQPSIGGNDGPWDCSVFFQNDVNALTAMFGSGAPLPVPVPIPVRLPEEEPMREPMIRRTDDHGDPVAFEDYPFVYDLPARKNDTDLGTAKILSSVVLFPLDTTKDGTVVSVWCGDAGEAYPNINVSAFGTSLPVSGNGRLSIIAKTELFAYNEYYVVPK